jgi:dCTP deaminase
MTPGAWLTGHKIREEVERGRIKIWPFSDDCIQANSYDYRLDSHILRMTNDSIDLREPDEFEKIYIGERGYVMMPGECYLGSTIEVFYSPFYPAIVTGRSSLGRKFITNHITAGLIDQGFEGTITLEITVQKPTRVYPGIRFGQISWFEPSGDPMLYKGRYQNQDGPTPSRLVNEKSAGE